MNETLIFTITILVGLGLIAAVVLYLVARKFHVEEDPRIDEVELKLPSANCGGCGFAGCRGLASALVREDDISTLYCPVGGSEVMKVIAEYLGKAVAAKEPMIAAVRCGGAPCNRPRTNRFDGASSCAVIASLYGGETGCTWGCLGKGDCTLVCAFDAIHIDPETLIPEVDEQKCTACGACVKECPKMIIELRKKGPKGRRVFVNCVNKDKGAVTRKACSVGCIACGKCVKTCPFEAITLENNIAYIDFDKCRLCRKCVPVCPTHAITEENFPPRPPEKKEGDTPAKPAPKKEGVVADPVKIVASATEPPASAIVEKQTSEISAEPFTKKEESVSGQAAGMAAAKAVAAADASVAAATPDVESASAAEVAAAVQEQTVAVNSPAAGELPAEPDKETVAEAVKEAKLTEGGENHA